ncbi:DUF2971 domain-containing protein [Parvularcula flava]|uniref:DUF2971 domain-containing protein n=1 Tax=Aquisalinus luteolus TaxID=1566827 RepID=A0A8J3EPC0_9PROT|nr:DUF2971 domain-containing protein [Aquisalinus luteolus]NHK27698.1 DUF2971 domain-containing protein [Aquisalinus luteolus]GGH96227.1 hypothetical protein GCM10011355_14630 [Aquisalinus luteolus]
MTDKDDFIRLFRFRSVNEYLWQELSFSALFAGKPENLNDPFDCQINPFHSLDRAIKKGDTQRTEYFNKIKSVFKNHNPMEKEPGVCCFSCTMEEPLLWSHYADAHKGVCLMYDIPTDYISQKYSPTKSKDFYFVGSTSINYGDNGYYEWLINGDLNEPMDDVILNASVKLLSYKSKKWDYEQEYRILMSDAGFIELEPSFLKQVTFGLRTPSRHKQLLRKTVGSDVEYVRTLRDPESDFGLKFEGIS